jgi:putative Mn2+ efflux pump MntP
MPLLGAFAGEVFSRYTNGRLDNWIVLIVLGYVGAKMIADSFTCNEKSPPKLTAGAVLIQAVVTSIDALAAGVSLALMKLNVLAASVIIGVITFICCFIGVYIGAKCGDKLASKAGAVGGLLLIGIGIKSFIG